MCSLPPTRPSHDAGPAGALSPGFVGRLAGFFFLVASVVTAASLVLHLPRGDHRAAVAAMSVAAAVAGLATWHAPWPRWPAEAMRWTVPPAALALIAAMNHFDDRSPYTYVVAFPLVFAWVGLSQPRWTSLRLAGPAAIAYLLPLLAAHRPAGELFSAALVIPVLVGLGEAFAWVAAGVARSFDEQARTVALLRHEQLALQLLRVVAVAANEATTVDDAFRRAIEEICAYTAWPVGHAYLPDGDGVLAPTGLWHLEDRERFESFRRATEETRFRPGAGLLDRVVRSGEPAWVVDVSTDPYSPRAAGARQAGLRAAFGLPVLVDGEVVAVLEFFSFEPLEPDEPLLELARHVGTQLGRVVERRRSEETLRASEERIRAVIDTAGDAFIGMDAGGIVTEWNREAEVMFGWSRADVLGQPVAELIVPPDLGEHQAGLGRFLCMGMGAILGRRLEMQARDRGGRDFPVELTVWSTPVGSDAGLNAFIRDISERKSLEGELTRRALHDSLTGLPNRVLMLDRLGHALARGQRSGAAVTVLFLDLDGFKRINDSLGHAAGDRVLAGIAERLGGALRPSDTIARIGGDEFAVLLEDTGTVDGARIAERIGEALESPFVIDGHEALTQASIGVATGKPGEQSADDLIRNADLAMCKAKAQGKAGYAVFEPGMHLAVVERLEFEAALRRALGLGEFFLLYQPVVRLADGSVVGMEALIRWKRAGGAVVSPEQFIPVAEETGLIRDIGRWVLQEACGLAAAWQSEYAPTPALRLSVNLSARQLQDPGLVKDVEAVLASSGLEPACLVLEITESLLMSEPDVAVQRLGDLKDLGVKLAIDDFGTGYSSLSYLRRFPVDVLKIDRSFVTALGTGPEDCALVHAIVDLGQTLRLRVVAEGIETPAELQELQRLDCEYGQGYLFARPLTAEAMSRVIADARQARGLFPPRQSALR